MTHVTSIFVFPLTHFQDSDVLIHTMIVSSLQLTCKGKTKSGNSVIPNSSMEHKKSKYHQLCTS